MFTSHHGHMWGVFPPLKAYNILPIWMVCIYWSWLPVMILQKFKYLQELQATGNINTPCVGWCIALWLVWFFLYGWIGMVWSLFTCGLGRKGCADWFDRNTPLFVVFSLCEVGIRWPCLLWACVVLKTTLKPHSASWVLSFRCSSEYSSYIVLHVHCYVIYGSRGVCLRVCVVRLCGMGNWV